MNLLTEKTPWDLCLEVLSKTPALEPHLRATYQLEGPLGPYVVRPFRSMTAICPNTGRLADYLNAELLNHIPVPYTYLTQNYVHPPVGLLEYYDVVDEFFYNLTYGSWYCRKSNQQVFFDYITYLGAQPCSLTPICHPSWFDVITPSVEKAIDELTLFTHTHWKREIRNFSTVRVDFDEHGDTGGFDYVDARSVFSYVNMEILINVWVRSWHQRGIPYDRFVDAFMELSKENVIVLLFPTYLLPYFPKPTKEKINQRLDTLRR
jgi:hypothetical protein